MISDSQLSYKDEPCLSSGVMIFLKALRHTQFMIARPKQFIWCKESSKENIPNCIRIDIRPRIGLIVMVLLFMIPE